MSRRFIEEKALSSVGWRGGGGGGLAASGGGDRATENFFSVSSFATSASRSIRRSLMKALTCVPSLAVSSVSSV